MKKISRILIYPILLGLIGVGWAQTENAQGKRVKTNAEIEEALLKSGKVVRKDGKIVFTSSTSSAAPTSQVQESPIGVEISNTSHLREVFKPFYPVNVKWVTSQDKVVIRKGNDVELLSLATGTQEKAVTLNQSGWQPLVLSPDGKSLILFEGGATYLYSFPSKKKTMLLPHDKGRAFVWSPDSKQVALEYEDSVWVITVANKEAKNVSPKNYRSPKWLDNHRIQVAKRTEKGNGININLLNGKEEKVTDVAGYKFPNAERMIVLKDNQIYIRDSIVGTKVKIADETNANPRKLRADGGVAISPDGTKVAYTYQIFEYDDDWQPGDKWPQTGSEIFVYDTKDKKTINVTNTPREFEAQPQWSSDGTKIYCVSKEGLNDKMPALVEISLH